MITKEHKNIPDTVHVPNVLNGFNIVDDNYIWQKNSFPLFIIDDCVKVSLKTAQIKERSQSV